MAHQSNESTIFVKRKDGGDDKINPTCCELLRNNFDHIKYSDVYINIDQCDYSEIELIKWIKYLNLMGFTCEYVGNHDDDMRKDSYVIRNYTEGKVNGRHYLATHTGIRYLYTPLFRNIVSSFIEYINFLGSTDKKSLAKAVVYSHFHSKGVWDRTFNWYHSKNDIYYNENPDFKSDSIHSAWANNSGVHITHDANIIKSVKKFDSHINEILNNR